MPERMTRRRSTTAAAEEPEETSPRGRRRRSTASEEPEEKPTRRARASKSEGDEKPSRRRSGGTSGFASFSQKKRNNSTFADEFKPDSDHATLIKFLEPEPFDTYNQHWIEEGNASGKTRHSFVCRDDEEYFETDAECPLCEIGEPASTYSLFNILDLSNPDKPEVKVWRTSPAVTDKLLRISQDKKTKPLDREDLYFEATMVKKKNKTEWDILPVKARDLAEDFDMDPLDEAEIEDFAEKKFADRTAVTKVDSYEELQELADSIE